MVRFLRRVKFILNIRRFVPFLLDFFTSREVPMPRKLFSVLLLVGYALFPFDAIPDFLMFFGILDDVMVLTFILQQIVKSAPQSLKDKYQLITS